MRQKYWQNAGFGSIIKILKVISVNREGNMSKAKILVIDDEEIIREIFMSAFDEYEIMTVSNGTDALEILTLNQDIAIILIDVQIPELQGIELLMEMKIKSPQSHLIILTGHSMDDEEVKLIAAEAEGCIEKPFDIGTTRELFLDLLNR